MRHPLTGGLLVDRNPCFKDIIKLLSTEWYIEILYKRYTTYHSSMWTQNGVFLVGADISKKSFFYQG